MASEALLQRMDVLRYKRISVVIKEEPIDDYDASYGENAATGNDFNKFSNSVQHLDQEENNAKHMSMEHLPVERREHLGNTAEETTIPATTIPSKTCLNEKNSVHIIKLNSYRRNVNRICHICGKQYKNITKWFFNSHLLSHKLRPSIKCKDCGANCRSHWAIKFHKQNAHKSFKTVRRKGVRSVKLQRKTKRTRKGCDAKKTTKTAISCVFCDRKFYSNARLQEHFNNEHFSSIAIDLSDSSQYDCPFCGEMFSAEFMLTKHFEAKHADLLNP